MERREQLPKSTGYRFRFPSQAGPGPLLVTLEYMVPSTSVRPSWTPPRLLNGIVQQTRLGSGGPIDPGNPRRPFGAGPMKNQWYWDRFVWRRRLEVDRRPGLVGERFHQPNPGCQRLGRGRAG